MLYRDDNFAQSHLDPPLSASPCVSFSNPAKVVGARMGQDFSPTPQGEVGMGIDFLALPNPCPALH